MKSTKGKLIITEYAGNMLSLLLDKDNKVQRIGCESLQNESLVGNIYIGRVTNIMKNLDAVFIEFANGSPGYLPLENGKSPIYVNMRRKDGPIRTGDRLIVQISKDSTKSKWPVVSCDIEMVGKNLIFFPAKKGLSFSKRFSDPEKKKQIKARFDGQSQKEGGYIVRTNAQSATLRSMIREAEQLQNDWESIRGAAARRRGTPCLYQAQPVYIADIRDTYSTDIREILTDSRKAYNAISGYLQQFQPEDLGMLKLYNDKSISLDTVYGITRQVEEALSSRVWLKSGGYIVIEHTEALTAIDVNTGKSVSSKSPQKEYLLTNLEAAAEVARQLRLRNLSGIIIVDFINMKAPEDNETLMTTLEAALAADPVKPDLVDMTALGLVEITRKKGRRPLYELLKI